MPENIKIVLTKKHTIRLIASAHFKSRLAERGVSWDECEETINNPTRKSEKGKGSQGGVKYIYEKDFADRTIVVVVGENLPKTRNVLGITVWKKDI